jgi:hypothetical protein
VNCARKKEPTKIIKMGHKSIKQLAAEEGPVRVQRRGKTLCANLLPLPTL